MADHQTYESRHVETQRSSGTIAFIVGGLVVAVALLAYIIFGAVDAPSGGVSTGAESAPASTDIDINTSADSAAGAEAAEDGADAGAAATTEDSSANATAGAEATSGN